MFNRKCPNCECILSYTNKKNRNNAEKNKVFCKLCTMLYKKIETLKKTNKFEARVFNKEQKEYIISKIKNPKEIRRIVGEVNEGNRKKTIWIRKCPKCNCDVEHKTINSMKDSEKKKSSCIACYGEKRSKNMTGSDNHFYGKHHTDETKKKIKASNDKSEKRADFIEKINSEEHKKKLSERMSGEKNPRFNRSLTDIWKEKYDEKEVERREKKWKKKLSDKFKGEKNHMFGKPSPQGSGNGWSGWYKNWFFRSVLELSYMINVIEKGKIKWESAEKRKYMIKYTDFKGEQRNYFADFFINDSKIVEIKPERLKNSSKVIAKCKAAEEFCKNNGYEFEIITPKMITSEEIKKLYIEKKIKFTDKYEEKFRKKFDI